VDVQNGEAVNSTGLETPALPELTPLQGYERGAGFDFEEKDQQAVAAGLDLEVHV
jgi:hypothetical protein